MNTGFVQNVVSLTFFISISLVIVRYSGILRRNILGFHGENGWVPNNQRFDNEYYEELVGSGNNMESQIEGK